jgi:zinc/manganese transport system substrate-binding protein
MRCFPKLSLLSAMAWLLLAVAMEVEPGTARLPVVATFSVVGDLVRQVGGESIALQTLVGPDGDAHVFEPTPADAKALANATLIFENGLGFEPWLDKLYTASRSKAKRVSLGEGLPGLATGADAQARPDARAQSEVDPHVWHDVSQTIRMVQRIREALCAADPAQAAAYTAAAERYVAELQELEAWIFERVQALPATRRALVTAHDTFGYFARRYGFQVVYAVLPGFSTETSDPSGAETAALVTMLKAAGIPAIFPENTHRSPLVERVATAAGVRLAPPLYTDALGPRGSPGETYAQMMRANVTTIVEALAR